MPASRVLGAMGVSTMASLADTSCSASAMASSLMSLVASAVVPSKAPDTIVVLPGIPPLRRSVVETIQSGAFLDFAELPPAKGLSKPKPVSRLIPDFTTWVQCFAMYAAVLIAKAPERSPSLLSYMATMAQFSKRYTGSLRGFYTTKSSGARQPNPAGLTWMGASTRIVLLGTVPRGVVRVGPLITLRAQDSPPPSVGSKRPFSSSFSTSNKQSLRGGLLRRQSWSPVDDGTDRESRTARLGIASICMCVQHAKETTQSQGARSGPADVLLKVSIKSEQFRTVWIYVHSKSDTYIHFYIH